MRIKWPGLLGVAMSFRVPQNTAGYRAHFNGYPLPKKISIALSLDPTGENKDNTLKQDKTLSYSTLTNHNSLLFYLLFDID
jgi:hypothetical protein